MDRETYKATFSDDDTPGWAAIDSRLAKYYGEGEPDFHFGTIIKYWMGGPDPIDGVSIYKRKGPDPHLHYVSYGMSSLYYDEDSAGGEFSKWGLEFTFRLGMAEEDMPVSDDQAPVWPINLMQNMARYVFETEKWFEHGHFMSANGPIKLESDTKMVAMLFCRDPELGSMETPHGKVDFIQIVGLTQDEVDALFARRYRAAKLIEALSQDNPLLITDLKRSENALLEQMRALRQALSDKRSRST